MISYSRKNAILRFKQNRLAVWSLIILLAVVFACLFLPMLCGLNESAQDLILGPQKPSSSFWAGTDLLGRDLLARILYGGRISIGVGLAATAVALFIGLSYGLISGYAGGTVDRAMMRTIDIIYPLPFTLIVILLMAFLGRSIILLFLAIGCVKWLTIARIVRGQVISFKSKQFVVCAKSLGQSNFGILYKHILPNLMGTILIYTTLTIPNIMLEEAFISFLGLGVQPPKSSWGVLIFDGAKNMEEYPWLLIFPCAFFTITLFCLNFLGDGLRDALDPKSDN